MNSPIQSYALVFLQFLLIGLLASPISDFFKLNSLVVLGLVLIFGSAALASWALISMRRGTFRVMPEPSARSQLTTNGPYRYIRHPMYTSVLLAGVGAIVVHASLLHIVFLVTLVVVLHFKVIREEAALLERYPEYDDYITRSNALVPFLY